MSTSTMPPSIEHSLAQPLRPPARPRADLYWSPLMWAGGTELVWESREVAAQLGRLGGRDASTTSQEAAFEILGDPVAIDLLAALVSWGTATVEQLYAIAGHPLTVNDTTTWSRMPVSFRRLWLAGLVERGTSTSPAATLPVTVRIFKGRAMKEFLRRLNADQLAWVTGGRQITSPSRGDRHNLLATELGLLIAEGCDVAAVTGPASALHHELDLTGRTRPGRSAADLVVHEQVWVRLAIEITASANQNALRRKVQRWCDYLAAVDDNQLGVQVIWIDAADPVRQTPQEVWSPLTRIIRDEIRSRSRILGHHDLECRMHVARWRDWHTAAGPTEASTDLAAYTPTNNGEWWYEGVLTSLHMFPPAPDPSSTEAATASHSASSPAVLRPARAQHGGRY